MRTETCCDRHLEIPGVLNNTTGTLEQKKPTVEPRWVKQQTKKLRPHNWYNQIPHPALKTKRETTKYIKWQQFTKVTRGKPNEQLFPKQVVMQLPKIYKTCR